MDIYTEKYTGRLFFEIHSLEELFHSMNEEEKNQISLDHRIEFDCIIIIKESDSKYFIDFEESSNFNRFFYTYTNQTPLKYRQNDNFLIKNDN